MFYLSSSSSLVHFWSSCGIVWRHVTRGTLAISTSTASPWHGYFSNWLTHIANGQHYITKIAGFTIYKIFISNVVVERHTIWGMNCGQNHSSWEQQFHQLYLSYAVYYQWEMRSGVEMVSFSKYSLLVGYPGHDLMLFILDGGCMTFVRRNCGLP